MNQADTLQHPKETESTDTGAADGHAADHDAAGSDAADHGVDLSAYDTFDVDGRTDKNLFDLVVDLERSMQVLHAQAMIPQAAAARRHSHHARRFRSNATGLAASTGLSRKSCSNRTNQAVILVDHLPQIYAAYASCVMNRSQIDLICRLHNDRLLRPFLEQSQWVFLDLAGESWPVFRQRADQWARETRAREEPDPNPDEKAHQDRKLVWAQGLDREIIGEFHMPNEVFEQFLEIVTPFYDALLKGEIREARRAAGENPDLAPAEGEFFDLARSNSQRWVDALMSALRVRGSALRQAKQQLADAAHDPEADHEDDEIDIDELDAGVAAEVIIIVDHETLQRELARQNGHADDLDPRTAESMANARCETFSGLPVSPATALFYTQLGSFRRMIMKPNDLDFRISEKARLFKGAKRTGVMVRDRHCQGPGCETKASFCQADHVKEYATGGLTVPANGEALCGPCNRYKERIRLHSVR